jgi:chromosome segregation ATPase
VQRKLAASESQALRRTVEALRQELAGLGGEHAALLEECAGVKREYERLHAEAGVAVNELGELRSEKENLFRLKVFSYFLSFHFIFFFCAIE